jgi:hypothetical protein
MQQRRPWGSKFLPLYTGSYRRSWQVSCHLRYSNIIGKMITSVNIILKRMPEKRLHRITEILKIGLLTYSRMYFSRATWFSNEKSISNDIRYTGFQFGLFFFCVQRVSEIKLTHTDKNVLEFQKNKFQGQIKGRDSWATAQATAIQGCLGVTWITGNTVQHTQISSRFSSQIWRNVNWSRPLRNLQLRQWI